MIQKDSIIQTVNSFIEGTEYYLVDVQVSHDNNILVEIDSFNGVDVDFCSKLNRHIEANFDREVEDYELEVGSAGLTEPFKITKQYEKNLGNEVEVLTKKGLKHTGVLVEVNENDFAIELEKSIKPEGAKRKVTIVEKTVFNYADIKTTKYIIRFK